MAFGNLVRLFSSSRRSDTVCLGSFVGDLVGKSLKMEAWRQLVKAHYDSGPISSSRSTGFQVYLSNCWDPYVSPGCMIQLAFFWVFLPCLSMLTLSLPHLGLSSKPTSFSRGFCVPRPKQYVTICWKLDLTFRFFFFFFVVDCLGGWNQ